MTFFQRKSFSPMYVHPKGPQFSIAWGTINPVWAIGQHWLGPLNSIGGKCNWKLDWEGRKLQLMPYKLPPSIVGDRLRRPAASPRDIRGMSSCRIFQNEVAQKCKKCKFSKKQKMQKMQLALPPCFMSDFEFAAINPERVMLNC